MLLDYQIGLNFAPGVGSLNAQDMTHESALGTHLNLFYSELTRANYYIIDALCRIRRTYIHIRNSGRAWQPSPTRNLCLVEGSLFVRADTAVRPYAEDL